MCAPASHKGKTLCKAGAYIRGVRLLYLSVGQTGPAAPEGTTPVTRFADLHTRLADDARVTQIRKDEAARFDARFAPAKAKAAANVAAWNAPRTWALA